MELNIYNKECISLSYAGPAVRLTKQGVIYFTKTAMELLNLSDGNMVSFANDKTRPKDWYLFRDADGMPLKPKSGKDTKTGDQSYGISSKFLVTKIKETLSIPADKNISIEIAREPLLENGKAYYALLTSKINLK